MVCLAQRRGAALEEHVVVREDDERVVGVAARGEVVERQDELGAWGGVSEVSAGRVSARPTARERQDERRRGGTSTAWASLRAEHAGMRAGDMGRYGQSTC